MNEIPHYKIRLVIRGAGMIHLASYTEPWWEKAQLAVGGDPIPPHLIWEPVEEPGYGDTISHIEWREVAAVSWRYHP